MSYLIWSVSVYYLPGYFTETIWQHEKAVAERWEVKRGRFPGIEMGRREREKECFSAVIIPRRLSEAKTSTGTLCDPWLLSNQGALANTNFLSPWRKAFKHQGRHKVLDIKFSISSPRVTFHPSPLSLLYPRKPTSLEALSKFSSF